MIPDGMNITDDKYKRIRTGDGWRSMKCSESSRSKMLWSSWYIREWIHDDMKDQLPYHSKVSIVISTGWSHSLIRMTRRIRLTQVSLIRFNGSDQKYCHTAKLLHTIVLSVFQNWNSSLLGPYRHGDIVGSQVCNSGIFRYSNVKSEFDSN